MFTYIHAYVSLKKGNIYVISFVAFYIKITSDLFLYIGTENFVGHSFDTVCYSMPVAGAYASSPYFYLCRYMARSLALISARLTFFSHVSSNISRI